MELINFRIRNYKSILDSQWIEVSGLLTTNSGQQGVSANKKLVEALYKFNPYNKNSRYSLKADWPLGLPGIRRTAHVCYAKFKVSDEDKKEMEQSIRIKFPIEHVIISKSLNNEFKVHFKFRQMFPKNKYYPFLIAAIEDFLLSKIPVFIYKEDYIIRMKEELINSNSYIILSESASLVY